jgi:hypothetical protein
MPPAGWSEPPTHRDCSISGCVFSNRNPTTPREQQRNQVGNEVKDEKMPEQHNSMTFGRILTLFLVAVLICGFIAFKACRTPQGGHKYPAKIAAAQPDPHMEEREQLKTAIVIAGTPLEDGPEPKTMDFNYQKGRFLALYEQRKLTTSNPYLSKSWVNIQSNTDTGIATLQRISELENVNAFSEAANLAAHDEALNGAVLLAGHYTDIAQAKARFLETEGHLNDAIASLKEAVNALSQNQLPKMVEVKYFPSWEGVYPGDMLLVKNTSGAPIEHASIIVSVRMSDSPTQTHVHYVDHWAVGAKLGTIYPYLNSEYANSQTGDHPESVDVTVFLPTGTSNTTIPLGPAEWEQITRNYCTDTHIEGEFLGPYTEDSTNRIVHSGYKLTLTGPNSLPLDSVDIKFTWAGQGVRTYHYSAQQWEKMKLGDNPYRDPSLDEDQTNPVPSLESRQHVPSNIDIVVHLSGTSYTPPVDTHGVPPSQ